MSDDVGSSPDLRIVRGAEVQRIDLGMESWVDLVESFVAEPEREFDDLHQTVDWQQGEVLRYDRYVAEKRLGAGLAEDRHPLLRQTGLHLRARYRQRFDGVGALLYRTGDDFQGLHSDREMRWLDETLIAIVVLGVRRPFVFRERRPLAEVTERAPAGSLDGDIVLTPGRGDLLVMGGACQRDWLHGIPAAATDGPRISLTWRWTSRRGRPDTNPSYYDGRQYSDRRTQTGHRNRRPGDR
jgi:alkylated DNA repair dioxygenase AlkB